jgi:hypothetical protein
LKERYFWAIMVIIIIAWIGNYTYLKSKQLDSPVILSHFYEKPFEENMRFKIYYLTNKNSQVLSYADFGGITAYPFQDEGMPLFDTNQQPKHEREFRHHYLKSVFLEIRDDFLPLQKDSGDVWTTNEIKAYFNHSNGNKPESFARFGKLSIKAGYQGERVFRFQMAGSRNDNRSYSTNGALQDLTVDEIITPFKKQLGKHIDIKIGVNIITPSYEEQRMVWGDLPGESLEDINFPLNLDKGDSLSIYTQIDAELKSYVEMALKLKGRTADGKPFESPILINSQPFFQQEDIDRIITEKTGGDK